MENPEAHEIEITVDEGAASPAHETRPTLGNYQLIASLGRGGMGDVFLAMRRGLAGFSKLVVIKQLRASLVADPEVLQGFLDEARLAAGLNHPNIVQTNEVGQDSAGHYFIAMEYLDGQTLHHLQRKDHDRAHFERLSLNVLLGVLDGLHYAHDAVDLDGHPMLIVHRDISPQNVFVTYSGEVKLLDFGIAKAVSSTVETRSGVYKGKLHYMSPEQINGDPLDRRADLFAVGVMLWSAVAGRPMWQGRENLEIARCLMAGKLPSLAEARPDTPQPLLDLCERALAPRVDERFATALEFRHALHGWLASRDEVLTRNQVAEAVSTLFASERRQTQRSIDGYLRAAKTAGALSVTQLPVVDPSAASGEHGSSTISRVDHPPSSVIIHTGTGWKIAAIVLPLSLITGAGLTYLMLGRTPPPLPAPVVATPTPAPAVVATPPAPPTTASLTLVTVPPDAQLTLDGKPVTSPWTGTVALGAHALRVEAPGFQPQVSTVDVTQATALEVRLQKLAAPPAPVALKKRPTKAVTPARPKSEPDEGPKPTIQIVNDPAVQILE